MLTKRDSRQGSVKDSSPKWSLAMTCLANGEFGDLLSLTRAFLNIIWMPEGTEVYGLPSVNLCPVVENRWEGIKVFAVVWKCWCLSSCLQESSIVSLCGEDQ